MIASFPTEGASAATPASSSNTFARGWLRVCRNLEFEPESGQNESIGHRGAEPLRPQPRRPTGRLAGATSRCPYVQKTLSLRASHRRRREIGAAGGGANCRATRDRVPRVELGNPSAATSSLSTRCGHSQGRDSLTSKRPHSQCMTWVPATVTGLPTVKEGAVIPGCPCGHQLASQTTPMVPDVCRQPRYQRDRRRGRDRCGHRDDLTGAQL